MSAVQSVVSWNLPGGVDNSTTSYTYWGSVISANPTATTVAISCTPCLDLNPTMTFGPWAQITPPPNVAATGAYDAVITFPILDSNFSATGHGSSFAVSTETNADGKPAMQTFSVHCDMVSTTVAAACTEKYFGAAPAENSSTTSSTSLSSQYGISLTPVTITAGLDKLASITSTGGAAQPTSTSKSNNPTGPTSASATAGHTGAASSVYGVNSATLSLLGLLAAFFVR
ncbi:hypothetical protein K461DRAFT_265875 [Myriangium duriaei CBS 260.36]|uniref:Uncharacterized protein n=1 Tax=Myriangium duriaei CBS 260.36 TaxID=1168546 RepID=A0A9P4J7I6_9PEZI|nr:hypothetical protein K461DRAFT_265875 [Myriangium duriaei CBS 260.36]